MPNERYPKWYLHLTLAVTLVGLVTCGVIFRNLFVYSDALHGNMTYVLGPLALATLILGLIGQRVRS